MSRPERKVKSKQSTKELDIGIARAAELIEENRLHEAKDLCEQLLTQGENSKALNLLAVIAYRGGNPNLAIGYFKRLLDHDPTNAEGLHSLGNLLLNLGYKEQALEMYKSVLTHAPNHPLVLKVLSKMYADAERWPESFLAAQKLLKDQPWHDDVWQRMKEALPHVPRHYLNHDFMQQMMDSLDNPANNPTSIVILSVQAACFAYPMFDACVKSINLKGAQGVDHLSTAQLSEILDIPLLHAVLRQYTVAHPGFEKLMTLLRRRLLMLPAEEKLENYSTLLLTLASQGYVNEYVYYQSPEEQARVTALQTEMEAAELVADAATVCKLLLLGAYVPLSTLACAEALPAIAKNYKDKDFRDFIALTVAEVLEERTISQTIKTIGTIEDSVSQAVQGQYEENPYPRWISYGDFPAETTEQVMRRLFPRFDMTLISPSPRPEVLIAGCGTGKHAVGVARRFKNSKVAAVDLSRASLSYAIRKSREYGIGNVDYYQADILKLGELNRQFDVVESVGVLHHMRDPVVGWKVLVDLLKPGGVMKIGLYSAKARESIAAMREEIAARGIGDSADEIRQFRHELMQDLNILNTHMFANSRDFYSISECRDLLFHRQEHRTDLLEIRKRLDILGLKFMGLELSHINVSTDYMARFPDDLHWNNLDNWHTLEQDMPLIFFGMYQFWCYKPL